MLILNLLIIFVCVNSACISVYDEDRNTTLSTDIISYLYHKSETVERVNIFGRLYTNLTLNIREHANLSLFENVYVLHKVEEESVLGAVDMARIYRTAYENGYNGVIISSSSSKLTGEAMYFHYRDDAFYPIGKFEVREGYLTDVMNTFPDGGYFEITVTEDCDPYFNYWMDFYTGVMFHVIWITYIVFSSFVMICIIYVTMIKWKDMMLILRLCAVIYTISELMRIWDGVFYIRQKYYRQGELVLLFQISDVIGGITAYSMSLSALVLWVSNFHLSLDVNVIDFSETSRIVAIITAFVMFTLTVVGVMFLVFMETSVIYYISIVFFIALLLVSTGYYFKLTFTFLSVFSNTTRGNEKLQRKIRSHFRNILTQNILLVLTILSTIPTFYIVSPVQTNVFPFLVHTFFNVVTLMQFWYIYNIKTKTKVSTTTDKAKTPSSNTSRKSTVGESSEDVL